MILAAGLGTRLKPFTDHHPKALAEVNGKSLLQHNVEYLASHGIFDVIVNVHHFAGQIIDAVQENGGWGSRISISDESGEVLETGGGLKKAAPFLVHRDEGFVLMNADILTDLPLRDMIHQHLVKNPLATLATTKRKTSRYLLFNENDRLVGWKNVTTNQLKGNDGDARAFSGIHIISPRIFPLITEEGKFSMIDLYLRLCQKETILSYDHSKGILQDVGKAESITTAEKFFK